MKKTAYQPLALKRRCSTCTLSDYPEEKANSFMLKVKLNRKVEGKNQKQ